MIWLDNISRRYTNCQQAHENMFNITNYKEKTNRNYSEASLSQRKEIRGVGKKNMKKGNSPTLLVGSFTVWNTVWGSHKKLRIKIPYDPVPTSGYLSEVH